MKLPKDITYIDIDECNNFVTNADPNDIKENYAFEYRGLRNDVAGYLGNRDWGTKHRMLIAAYANLIPNNRTSYTILKHYTFLDTKTGYEHEIVVIKDNAGDVRIFVDKSNDCSGTFTELTRRIKAKIDCTPDSETYNLTLDYVRENEVVQSTIAADELIGWIAVNESKSNATCLIVDNDALASEHLNVTTDANVGTGDLNWENDDDITLYRCTGIYNAYMEYGSAFSATQLGANPHLEFNAIPEQRKVNLYYGNSASPPVMQKPLQISYQEERNIFYDVNGNPLITLPAGWYIEMGGGGLHPHCAAPKDGGVIYPTDGAQIAYAKDNDIYNWLKIDVTANEQYSGNNEHVAVWAYLTLTYNGYQESDPVVKFIIARVTNNYFIWGRVKLFVNLARMPKNITHINYYVADESLVMWNAAITMPNSSYKEIVTPIMLREHHVGTARRWAKSGSASDGYIYYVDRGGGVLGFDIRGEFMETTNRSISDNLQHEPDLNRSYLTPRGAYTMLGSENPFVVVDQDDRTLRICSLDGWGAIADDNFPDLKADNLGNAFKLPLLGKGHILKTIIMDNVVYVFKQSIIESYDLKHRIYNSVTADVYGKDSIVLMDNGIAFGGRKGIYVLPRSGSKIELLNPLWQNLWDGSLLTENKAKSRINDSARQAAKFFYNSFMKELICQVSTYNAWSSSLLESVCHIFSEITGKWRERPFSKLRDYAGTGDDPTLTSFSTRQDGTFTLANSSFLFKYPNNDPAGLLYEESVLSDGSTANRYIPVSLGINFGSLYNLVEPAIPVNLRFGMDAKSNTGNPQKMSVLIYINDSTTASQTMNIPVDGYQRNALFKPLGQCERMRMRIILPNSTYMERFNLYKMTMGFIKRFRGE